MFLPDTWCSADAVSVIQQIYAMCGSQVHFLPRLVIYFREDSMRALCYILGDNPPFS